MSEEKKNEKEKVTAGDKPDESKEKKESGAQKKEVNKEEKKKPPEEAKKEKEKPLEKPKEKEEFRPGPKVEVVEPEETGSNSMGFIVIIALILVLAYFIWRSPAKPGPAPHPTATEIVSPADPGEDAKLQTAMEQVKEAKGPKTQIKLIDRIDSYKEKQEKSKNLTIEKQNWDVKPAQGKAEAMRYYDVTFTWKENGNPVVFAWQIDMESGNVVAMNKAAKDLDDFDTQYWKDLAEDPTPTPVPTLTPTQVPSPTPEPTEDPTPVPTLTPITPVPTEDPTPDVTVVPTPVPTDEIEILPPTTPTPAPDSTPGQPPPIPRIEPDKDFYQLTGVLTLDGRRNAMLMVNNRVHTGPVGYKLPDDWVIQTITDESVTLVKGNTTRVITLQRDGPIAPKPPQTQDPSSYPKAEPKDDSKADGPPPVPGLAPPVPPAPGAVPPMATPTSESTIIPID